MNRYWYAHNESECIFVGEYPPPEDMDMYCDPICPCVTGKKEEVLEKHPGYKDYEFHEPPPLP